MGMLMLQTIPERDKYTVRIISWNLDGADKVILCFVDRASLYNLVNKTSLLRSFLSIFICINLFMFWATTGPTSGDTTVLMQHLLLVILCGWLSGMQGGMFHPAYQTVINRRYNCVDATLVTCYSVWMTVSYAGWNVPPCIPDSHPHSISTKCHKNTVVSPVDDCLVCRVEHSTLHTSQ